MKVFISWSGIRSRALANALKEWVPLIVQNAKPWVSDKDIAAGDRWAQAIAGELESSNFGMLCITPENLTSEWILFEAGALSKAMQDAKVIPLLFGLELSDLSGPLSQFQALKVDEQGMLAALKTVNDISDAKTDEATIEALVPALWPRLQEELERIPDKEDSGKHIRPQREVLEDLVSQVRGLGARMRDPDGGTEAGHRTRNRRLREFHPLMIEELVMTLEEIQESDKALLLIAGLVRDMAPWLSEVLVEGYRDLRTATPREMPNIARRLVQVVRLSMRTPMAERMLYDGAGAHMLINELPRLVERVLRGQVGARSIVGRETGRLKSKKANALAHKEHGNK